MSDEESRAGEDHPRRATGGGVNRRQVLRGLAAAGGGALGWRLAGGLGMFTSLAAEGQAPPLPAGAGNGRTVAVIGAGVAGLTAAYRLLQAGFDVQVIEARPVIGGRSLTLRHGDVLVERPPRPYVDDRRPSSEQRCVFQPSGAQGFDRPYLNAGPGRIPSAHTHVLDLCRELRVPLEVYVMESRSNLVRSAGRTLVNRHVGNDARGWIAQALFERVDSMPLSPAQREALRGLLVQFGALGSGMVGQRGVYARDGVYQRSDRAGYRELPGVEPGEPVTPLPLAEILATRFWERPFYQPEDFLWQPTLFQPVGGMDRLVQALADAVGRDRIRTGVPVLAIRHVEGRWRLLLSDRTLQQADVCISNVPLPLLREPLGDFDLQPFDPTLKAALGAVFAVPPTGVDGFLAPTTKVGWQAKRALWQQPDPAAGRVVPIYGGISWTEHPMTQLWYPSDRVHDDLGVLTGAYNFRHDATAWGERSPGWRLTSARQGAAELGGTAFAAGLGAGLAIAWQNVEHLRGGWAQWQNVPKGVDVYSRLVRGDQSNHFYFVGDQLSQLPGWQEGAVASALHTVAQLAVPGYEMPAVDEVPDSRLVVEGMMPVE